MTNALVVTQDRTQEEKILAFCSEAKSFLEIMQILGYKERKTVRKYLNPLIEQGRVAMTVPDISPNTAIQKTAERLQHLLFRVTSGYSLLRVLTVMFTSHLFGTRTGTIL